VPVAAIAAVLLTGLGPAATHQGAIAAAVAAPTACPDVLPTADIVRGLHGTGWVVQAGTDREPFSVTVLGRIENGIRDGVDMIMADLDSPALTRAGGVWQGMSGSPVYTDGGLLIGAVAYGYGGSSTIAGLTPAADLRALLGGPEPSPRALTRPQARGNGPDAALGRERVRIGARAATALAASGEVSAAAATGEYLYRLDLPLLARGGDAGGEHGMRRLRQKVTGVRVVNGGGAGTSSLGDPAAVVPGGLAAIGLSDGSASLSGVGTVTLVCEGRVVAFGHPFTASGAAGATLHTASAVTVQPDGADGPFVLANVGGVVGTVTDDRTAGVVASLGPAPERTVLTTSLTDDRGRVFTATTNTSDPYWIDVSTEWHVAGAVAGVLGAEASGGSAELTLTIEGERQDGRPFRLVRTRDRYSLARGLAGTVGMDVAGLVWALADQPYEDARLTRISVTGTVSERVTQERVVGVQVRSGNRYVRLPDVLRVGAGETIRLRVQLAGYRDNRISAEALLDIPLPRSTAGRQKIRVTRGWKGTVGVSAGEGIWDEWGDFDPLEFLEHAGDDLESFDSILGELAKAPPADQISGVVVLADSRDRTATRKVALRRDAVVMSFSREVTVRVV
jgi:hypothetical protein